MSGEAADSLIHHAPTATKQPKSMKYLTSISITAVCCSKGKMKATAWLDVVQDAWAAANSVHSPL